MRASGEWRFVLSIVGMRIGPAAWVSRRKAGKVEQLDRDLVLADGDPLGYVLDDLTLLFLVEGRPARGEILGF